MAHRGLTKYGAIPLGKRYRYVEELPYVPKTRKWATLLYDFERGRWLSRSPYRWLLLFLFYMCFFLCLALLWAFSYLIFSYYLTVEKPRWFLSQPGLSFQPSMKDADNKEIKYFPSIDDDIERIVGHLNTELGKYGNVPELRFINCNIKDGYGYKKRQPCFFLKINKILNYKAETYTKANELPKFAPPYIKNYINNMTATERGNKLWLSCQTKPHIELEYIPQPYVEVEVLQIQTSHKYIRENLYYGNHEDDNKSFFDLRDFERIVAVRPRKRLLYNKEYDIRCYVFAKNIIIEKHPSMSRGTIHFKLQILDASSANSDHLRSIQHTRHNM